MACRPCLGADVKKAILEEIPGLKELLVKVADCEDPEGLELCGKTGRARSAYQEFTSQCLKAKKLTKFDPTALKDCARQWRARPTKS